MAIDSRTKRQSAASMFAPYTVQAVSPDATEPSIWRATVAWIYGGIAAAAGVTLPITGTPFEAFDRTVVAEAFDRTVEAEVIER